MCGAIGRLDAGRLMAARDTASDVGAGKTVPNQLVRGGLADCLTAGCKRLTEALRILAETTQPIDAELAAKMEKLRFDAYTLVPRREVRNLVMLIKEFNPDAFYSIEEVDFVEKGIFPLKTGRVDLGLSKLFRFLRKGK